MTLVLAVLGIPLAVLWAAVIADCAVTAFAPDPYARATPTPTSRQGGPRTGTAARRIGVHR